MHICSFGAHFDEFQQTVRPRRHVAYTPNDRFEMFLDKSGAKDIKEAKLREEGKELLKYFLIGITLPNESFWVNLRPDSPDKIIDPQLARTDIGKILLEADVQLKQDTALATSPDRPEGREYWNKLYAKAGELFGSENITIPTLTRPWIVPGEVIIRQTEGSVYVYKATLKVMLEEDYLKDRPTVPNNSETVSALNWKQFRFSDQRLKELNTYSTQLIKELIIPKLTQEVNSSTPRDNNSSAKLWTVLIKSSLRATKSVSQVNLTTANFPSPELKAITPSFDSRALFFSAIFWPDLRKISIALVSSSLACAKAFLTSTMPAPVNSLTFLISSKSAIFLYPPFYKYLIKFYLLINKLNCHYLPSRNFSEGWPYII